MATLSGASGTPTSITLTVSGMSSTTTYKRKYEYILAGQVMATVTDSTAGTTTASRIITGLTPDTLYICRVRIYNSNTGALVAETNSISVRTLAQSTSQATVSILNFLDNLTQLASGSFKGDIGDTFYISAVGTQYQTYSQQYHFLYFRLSSQNYNTEHGANYPIPIQEGQTVKVYYQSKTTTIPIYNYLDGQHTLSDGSVSGTIGNSFFLSMSGTQYQTYSQEYEFQYFRLASEGYATNHAATETIPITSGQAVRVYYKTKITAVAPWGHADEGHGDGHVEQERRRVRQLDALLGKDELYGDRIAVDRQLTGDGLGAGPGHDVLFLDRQQGRDGLEDVQHRIRRDEGADRGLRVDERRCVVYRGGEGRDIPDGGELEPADGEDQRGPGRQRLREHFLHDGLRRADDHGGHLQRGGKRHRESGRRGKRQHGIGRDEAGSDVLCKQLFCAQGSAQPGNQQL